MAKFYASDEDSDTKRKKKCSKFKEREENGKKCHKKNSSLYCSLHGEKIVTHLGSEKSLRQGLNISTILNMNLRITRGSQEK